MEPLTTADSAQLNCNESPPGLVYLRPTPSMQFITCKVVLIGDGDVGKTSLLINFANGCRGTGVLQHKETRGSDERKFYLPLTPSQAERAILLHVVDTAGQERYQAICKQNYRNAHVFVFVYSVEKSESRERIFSKWLHEALAVSPNASCFFVANKSDLIAEATPESELRVLNGTRCTVERDADKPVQAEQFLLVSARKGTNVGELLHRIQLAYRTKHRDQCLKLQQTPIGGTRQSSQSIEARERGVIDLRRPVVTTNGTAPPPPPASWSSVCCSGSAMLNEGPTM